MGLVTFFFGGQRNAFPPSPELQAAANIWRFYLFFFFFSRGMVKGSTPSLSKSERYESTQASPSSSFYS